MRLIEQYGRECEGALALEANYLDRQDFERAADMADEADSLSFRAFVVASL
ncbi:hypothetical protein FHW69_002826 [Luteibacter sp. Sphag1AF]|uniref:hypothetical protein n=1 Tax=Luteibacter sp. Sphag1AF TaxID=2587031 RepID=UPI0016225EE6|nr:hypothetical protein [Luteibacter sp. Sphag1AF]MBB3228191.1 hypothetical protein [Luteibacter sp. Sphag1AF]